MIWLTIKLLKLSIKLQKSHTNETETVTDETENDDLDRGYQYIHIIYNI